jgi:hypothetical protein
MEQVAVGALDRDAAEDRDRAGCGDRDGARAGRAQLHRRDVRDDTRAQAGEPADERDRQTERERQHQQQRRHEQHHPGDGRVGRRQQDRGGGDQTGHSRKRCARGRRVRGSAAALALAIVRARPQSERGEGIAREDVAQRREHRHDRGAHPAGDGERDALPADEPLRADGEGEREEGRVGVQHVDRELLAERQPQHARDQSEQDRVEQQHRDHRPRRVPVAAQIDDQPPALRDGQQHGVEREQEPHERADRREQGGRLVARRGRLGEQLLFVVDRLDVLAPARQARERRAHARS